MPEIQNLVFQGGGVKVIAEACALACLYEAGQLKNTTRACGTSAGSLLALLYSIGFNPSEIKAICMEKDFNDFKDGNIVTDGVRFLTEHGLYKGSHILEFVEQKIIEKLGCDPKITFAQLHAIRQEQIEKTGSSDLKDPYIVITNMSQRKAVVASFEDPIYKDMPISLAVRMSMSYPGAFASVEFKPTPSQPKQVYVDGGVMNNFALDIFDRAKYIADSSEAPDTVVFNPHTLGFRLDNGQEFLEFEEGETVYFPCSGLDFWSSLLETVINSQQGLYRDPENTRRTICSDTFKIPTMELGINGADKLKLDRSGMSSALEYLKANGINVDSMPHLTFTSVSLKDDEEDRDRDRVVVTASTGAKPDVRNKDKCVIS